jgi:hypothetical protein
MHGSAGLRDGLRLGGRGPYTLLALRQEYGGGRDGNAESEASMIGTTTTTTYRVTGTLLATCGAECYLRGLDVADVAHDEISVDLVVEARDAEQAASDAAWRVTYDYATWCWEAGPMVEEVTE